MVRRHLALALLLVACDGDSDDKPRHPPDPALMTAWEIGPKGYSIGMPLHPTRYADGWGFDFGPDAEPHYVTTRATLAGKSQIRMRYRVEAGIGTIIYGAGCSISSPSAVTLYFQKAGDDWSSDGNRWWATFASKPLSGAGDGEIVAPLDGPWASVRTKTAANSPADFAAAKQNTERVGFTFANCEGYGHGVRATGPVRFIVTRFVVE